MRGLGGLGTGLHADSLAVAAGALAREKAGIPVSRIAEELGRSEATIRNHLGGRTEAGRLVWETYEMLRRGEVDPLATALSTVGDVSRFRDKLSKAVKELEAEVEALKARWRRRGIS